MASGVARHSYLDFVTLKNGLTAKKLERREGQFKCRLLGTF